MGLQSLPINAMTLAKNLTDKIVAAASAARSKSIACVWCDGGSTSGYIVRSDGAVLGVGEFQDLDEGVYGTLADVSESDLALIFSHMAHGEDYLDDLRKHPGSCQLPNPLAVIAWLDAAR